LFPFLNSEDVIYEEAEGTSDISKKFQNTPLTKSSFMLVEEENESNANPTTTTTTSVHKQLHPSKYGEPVLWGQPPKGRSLPTLSSSTIKSGHGLYIVIDSPYQW
jgi:hypothetical protein